MTKNYIRCRHKLKVNTLQLSIKKHNMKLTDFKNKLCYYRAYRKLFISRLSYYVDFPSPVQVIAVLNCQNELRIARKEYSIHAQKCILNGSYLKN